MGSLRLRRLASGEIEFQARHGGVTYAVRARQQTLEVDADGAVAARAEFRHTWGAA